MPLPLPQIGGIHRSGYGQPGTIINRGDAKYVVLESLSVFRSTVVGVLRTGEFIRKPEIIEGEHTGGLGWDLMERAKYMPVGDLFAAPSSISS